MVLVLLLAAPVMAAADDAPKPASYIDAAAVDSKKLLPTPPANNSPETTQEIEYIFQQQSTRTPEQVARIQAEKDYSVGAFANVAGRVLDKVSAGGLPATAALLNRVAATAKPIADTAASDWNRQPPFAINSRVFPAVEKPEGGSYPSGASTQATIDALVLSQLVPGQKDAILQRGREIGADQVTAGVNFPSDVLAGRILGNAVFKQMMQDPQFKSDLAAAKVEVRGNRN